MQNIRHHYFLLFILLQLCACHQNNTSYTHIENSSIPEEILDMNIYEKIDSTLLYPKDCIMLNDSLIAILENKTQSVLSFYNLSSSEKVSEFGTIGDGPTDFTFPRLITELYDTTGAVLLQDCQSIYSLTYDNNHISSMQVLSMPFEIDIPNYILINNDTSLVTSCTSTYQLNFYDKKRKDIAYLNLFDDVECTGYDAFGTCMQIYDAVYASNDKYIAVGYKYWYMLDIYNIKTKSVTHISFDNYNANFKNKSYQSSNDFIRDKQRGLYFTKIIPYKDKFYLILWDGTSIASMDSNIVSSSVLVVAQDGEPIKRIKFNLPISSISLDSKGNIKYAIGMSPEDYGIHIYETSKVPLPTK